MHDVMSTLESLPILINVKFVCDTQPKTMDTKIISFSNIEGSTKEIPIFKRQVHKVLPRSRRKHWKTKHGVLDLTKGVSSSIMHSRVSNFQEGRLIQDIVGLCVIWMAPFGNRYLVGFIGSKLGICLSFGLNCCLFYFFWHWVFSLFSHQLIVGPVHPQSRVLAPRLDFLFNICQMWGAHFKGTHIIPPRHAFLFIPLIN